MELISKALAQQIVNSVKSVCNQNINFIDDKGLIVASTVPERIGGFHEAGYRVVTTGSAIEVSEKDNFLGTRPGINIPITYHESVVAAIGISGEPDSVRKYAYLARSITDILLMEQEFEANGAQKRSRTNYVIRCLINGEEMNSTYFAETLKENALTEYSICRIVIVKLLPGAKSDNLILLHSSVTTAFGQMRRGFYRYNYPDEYILITDERNWKHESSILRELAGANAHSLSIGVGGAVDIRKSRSSYQCARIALSCTQKDTPFVVYDDLGFELILADLPGERQKSYCDKMLGGLSDEDCRLLKVYFEHDMSLKKTCETVYLHKNSLQYKLNRIYNQCSYNPRRFRDAVSLYVALRLKDLKCPGITKDTNQDKTLQERFIRIE